MTIGIFQPPQSRLDRLTVPRLWPSGVPQILPPAEQTADWKTYRDAELRASFRYPRIWHLQTFAEPSRINLRGALASNVVRDLRHPEIPDGYTTLWDFRGLPADVVVVQVQHYTGGPRALPTERADTQFPLSFDEAQPRPQDPEEKAYGVHASFIIPITLHGDSRYAVIVWLGEEASEGDREIARGIVVSLAFDN